MGNPETYKTSWCWKFVGIYSFYKTWLGISFCCSRMSWFLRHVSSKMKNKHLRKKLREPFLMSALQLHQFHLFHDQKRDPSLDVSTIFLIKESTNNNWQEKEQTIPRPSSFLNWLVTLPFPTEQPEKAIITNGKTIYMGFHLDMQPYATSICQPPHRRRTTFWLQLHHVHDQSNVKLE